MDPGPGSDSIVLEEEIDPNYEPTEKEVLEYASWLGMDFENEKDLFWIAREGLKAPLPEHWKPCKTTDTEEIYYFNFSTGQSTWDHPCDEFYRKLYEEHKKKRLKSKKHENGEEKKNKEREDLSQLLGTDRGGKKRNSHSDIIGLSIENLKSSNAVSFNEKKPLPGITNKLNSLTSLSGPSMMNTLSIQDTKHDNSNLSGEDEVDDEEDANVGKSALRSSVGNLARKKPLPSPISSKKVNGLESNLITQKYSDLSGTKLEKKKDKLRSKHSKELKKLEEQLEEQLSLAQREHEKTIKTQSAANEDEIRKLKLQLEKKIHNLEDEFDRQENNIRQERKEKIIRLSQESEIITAEKRKDMETVINQELMSLQSRHNQKITELQESHDRKEKEIIKNFDAYLQEKANDLNVAKTLQVELDTLKEKLLTQENKVKTLENELNFKDSMWAERESHWNAEMCTIKQQMQESDSKEKCIAQIDRVPNVCSICETHMEKYSTKEQNFTEEQQRTEKALEKVNNLELQLKSSSTGKNADLERLTNLLTEKDKLIQTLESKLKEGEESYVSQVKFLQTKIQLVEDNRSDSISVEKDDKVLQIINEKKQMEERLNELEIEKSKILNHLNQQISQLSTENSDLRQELLHEAITKNEIIEQLEKSNKVNSNQQTECSQIKEKLARLEKEYHCKITENETLLAGMAAIESHFRSKKDQNDANTMDFENLNAKSNEQLLKISTQEEEIASLSANYCKTLEAKNECEMLNAQRLEDIQNERNHRQNRIATNSSSQDEVNRELSRLQVKNIELLAEITSSKSHGALLNEKYQSLAETNTTLKKALSNVEQQHEGVCLQVSNLQNTVDLKSGIINNLETELSTKIHENHELQDKIEEMSAALAELKQLQQSLEKSDEKFGELTSTNASEVSRLVSQVLEKDAQISSLKNDNKILADKNRAVIQQISDAERSNRKLQLQHDSLTLEKQQFENDAKHWREKWTSKSKEVDQLCADVAALENKQQMAEVENDRGRCELNDIIAINTQLENKVASLHKEIQENWRSQVYDLQENQRALTVDNRTLQSKNKRLENEVERCSKKAKSCEEQQKKDFETSKSYLLEINQMEEKLRVARVETQEEKTKYELLDEECVQLRENISKFQEIQTEQDMKLSSSLSENTQLVGKLQAQEKLRAEMELEMVNLKKKVELMSEQIKTAKDTEESASRSEKTAYMAHFQHKLVSAEIERDSALQDKEQLSRRLKLAESELVGLKSEHAKFNANFDLHNKNKPSSLSSGRFHCQTVKNASASGNVAQESMISCDYSSFVSKLKLADVSKSEIENHMRDVVDQLDASSRKVSVLESRLKDRNLEVEALYMENSSIRSAMLQLQQSTIMESLSLVEQLEYEHKKRVLKSDFISQLHEFVEREEAALIRQKARMRAKFERELDNMVIENEQKRASKLALQDQLTRQAISNIRQEREAQILGLKQKLAHELSELEEELVSKNEEHIKQLKKSIKKGEELLQSKYLDTKQIFREEQLSVQGRNYEPTEKLKYKHGIRDLSDNDEEVELFLSPGEFIPDSNRVLKHDVTLGKYGSKYKTQNIIGNVADNQSDYEDSSHPPKLRKLRKKCGKKRPRQSTGELLQRECALLAQKLKDEQKNLSIVKTFVHSKKFDIRQQAKCLNNSQNELNRKAKLYCADNNPLVQDMQEMIESNLQLWRKTVHELQERERWIKRKELKIIQMQKRHKMLTLRCRQPSAHSVDFTDEDELMVSNRSSDNDDPLYLDNDRLFLESLDNGISDMAQCPIVIKNCGICNNSMVHQYDGVDNPCEHIPLQSNNHCLQPFAFKDKSHYECELDKSVFFPHRNWQYSRYYECLPSHSTTRDPSILHQNLSMTKKCNSRDKNYTNTYHLMFNPSENKSLCRTRRAPSAVRSLEIGRRQIKRWAMDRERMRNAASQHAHWLSILAENVEGYEQQYKMESDISLDQTVRPTTQENTSQTHINT